MPFNDKMFVLFLILTLGFFILYAFTGAIVFVLLEIAALIQQWRYALRAGRRG